MSILERGKAASEERTEKRSREIWEATQAAIATGKHEVRSEFVRRFYPETLVDVPSQYGGNPQKHFGPDSPDPVITPSKEPGWMGGQYRYVPWYFEYEDIEWKCVWERKYRSASPGLHPEFYVQGRSSSRLNALRGKREWHSVSSPADVFEALA